MLRSCQWSRGLEFSVQRSLGATILLFPFGKSLRLESDKRILCEFADSDIQQRLCWKFWRCFEQQLRHHFQYLACLFVVANFRNLLGCQGRGTLLPRSSKRGIRTGWRHPRIFHLKLKQFTFVAKLTHGTLLFWPFFYSKKVSNKAFLVLQPKDMRWLYAKVPKKNDEKKLVRFLKWFVAAVCRHSSG